MIYNAHGYMNRIIFLSIVGRSGHPDIEFPHTVYDTGSIVKESSVFIMSSYDHGNSI